MDDLIGRVKQARHAIVLTVDGLLMASTRELGREDGEHLAAIAAGIQSLAGGVERRFGGGSVRQVVIEMRSALLFVTGAGDGACLAVLAADDVEADLIAYEMAMLVTRVGQFFTAPSRA